MSKILNAKRSLEKLGLVEISARLTKIERLTKFAFPEFSNEQKILDEFINLIKQLSNLKPNQTIEKQLWTPEFDFEGIKGIKFHPPSKLTGLSKTLALRGQVQKSLKNFANDILLHKAETITDAQRNKLSIAAKKLINLANFIENYYKLEAPEIDQKATTQLKIKLKKGHFVRETQKISRLLSMIYELSGDLWNRKYQQLADSLKLKIEAKKSNKLLQMTEELSPSKRDPLFTLKHQLDDVYTASPISYGEYINSLFQIDDISVKKYTNSTLSKINATKPENIKHIIEQIKKEVAESFSNSHPEVSLEELTEIVDEILSPQALRKSFEDNSFNMYRLTKVAESAFVLPPRPIQTSNEDDEDEEVGKEKEVEKFEQEDKKSKTKTESPAKHTIPRMPKNFLVNINIESGEFSIQNLDPVLAFWDNYLGELENQLKTFLHKAYDILVHKTTPTIEEKQPTEEKASEQSDEEFFKALDEQILTQLEDTRKGLT